jgi:glycosidase
MMIFKTAGLRPVLLIVLAGLMLAGLPACQPRPAVQSGPAVSEEPLDPVEVDPVEHPAWSRNLGIYEVNIRQYSPGGTFAEFAEHLPRLKEMGVGILWFMPIHPIGEKNRKGTMGSYYSVKDYFDVNPEYGTLEEFKALVDRIHGMDMYVILDWVANHSAWDNPLTRTHPDWYIRDVTGRFVPPVADWSDVIDFNYSRPGLQRYMIKAMKFWVEEVDVDGFRCDVAGMVPLEFWERARHELDKIKPVFMLAEWESPVAHEKAFDMTYSWDFYHLLNRIARDQAPASAVMTYVETQKRKYPPDAYRMYFITNHDENSWNGTVYERLGDAATAMTALVMTMDGMPLIYTGQEIGLNKRLAFFEKDPITWRDHDLTDFYGKLLDLKRRNRAMWNGRAGAEIEYIRNSNEQAVLAFIRQKGNDRVLALFNLDHAPQSVVLEGAAHAGAYVNVLTGETSVFREGEILDLSPWYFGIFETPGSELKLSR